MESAARVISEMDSDDAVDLLEDLDPEEKEQIVRMLDEDAKKDVKMLLSYDEEEIGSCMVPTSFTTFFHLILPQTPEMWYTIILQ